MQKKMSSAVDYCSTNISGVEATEFKILHYFLLSVNLFLERWVFVFVFRINIGHPNKLNDNFQAHGSFKQ